MERRKHPREKAWCPVYLEDHRGERRSGVIRDFSPGGLLVSLERLDDAALGAASVRIQGEAVSTAAEVRVVRSTGKLLALAFDRDQHAFAERVRQRSGAEGAPDAAPGGPPDLGRLLERVLDYVREQGEAVLEEAREVLFSKASELVVNSEQTPYYEAASQIGRMGTGLMERVVATIEAAGPGFEPIPASIHGRKTSRRELALVDETEFEIWLIESEIADSAENRLHQLLNALEIRLSAVAGETIESDNNPFGPMALAHHFAKTMEELELAPLARKALLRTFGKRVLNEAAGLYAVLNELLIDAGIHAEGVPRSDGHRAARKGPEPALPENWESVAEEEPAVATEAVAADVPQGMTATLLALQQLMGAGGAAAGAAAAASPAAPAPSAPPRARAPAGGAPADPGSPPGAPGASAPGRTLDESEFDELLGELQALAGSSSQRRLQDRLVDLLSQQQFDGSPAGLDEQQTNAVYLADQVVGAISEDLIASEQGKRWIRQLEIPLLRLLMDNPNVLAEPEHPGRRVLDQLGQVHWRAESPSPRERKMIESIDEVVSELVEHGQVDEPGLEQAAQRIEHIVRRQRQRVEANMRRVLETCQGQERLRQARRKVQALLAEQLGGRPVPKVLLEMLDKGYRDLLAVEALRADSGEVAEHALELLTELRDRLDAPPRSPLSEEDEALLARVEERLARSPAEPEAQREILARLREQFASEAGREAGVYEPEAPEDEFEEDYPSSEQEKLWLGQAKLLKVGDWMICPDENGDARPVRLAWISDDERRYVFVDRDGHRALDLRQAELARKLGERDAEIADQGGQPLVQRSWRGMIQRMHDQIAHQATHDDTTGLLNRKEFERRLRLKISESKLAGTEHAVLLTDIDGFRVINSTAGHETGDRMLKALGGLLRDNLPGEAELARVGSDEFAVLLPRCQAAAGDALAESLRGKIAAHRLQWKQRKLQVTASIGVTAIDRDTEGLSEIFTQVEVARDAAREDGDMVRRYTPDDQELTRKDRALQQVAQLEEALDADRLELHAHRIAPLCADEAGAQFEILARLRLEDGTLVTPEHFVFAAESHGRIHLLDHAVLEQTLARLAASPQRDGIARLCVNVSGQTFSRPHFAEDVAAALDRHGIESRVLCLEITESAAMSDLSRCADVLRKLKEMGVRFSLDDFGTGLSSFSYLKRLPVDYLKIDGSFIRDIADSSHDLGLVRTIHELAHMLGKQTVAEYVESPAIAEILRSVGIDFIQGHGVELPRPLTEVLSP